MKEATLWSLVWVLYIFRAFLVFTGIKMWWVAGQEPDLGSNPGVRMATPLLVVILLIGVVDPRPEKPSSKSPAPLLKRVTGGPGC